LGDREWLPGTIMPVFGVNGSKRKVVVAAADGTLVEVPMKNVRMGTTKPLITPRIASGTTEFRNTVSFRNGLWLAASPDGTLLRQPNHSLAEFATEAEAHAFLEGHEKRKADEAETRANDLGISYQRSQGKAG
jgi:hypothetical protein